MKSLVSVTILLLWLADAMAQAPMQTPIASSSSTQVPVQPTSGNDKDLALRRLRAAMALRADGLSVQTGDVVLVVPTADLTLESRTAILEDMTVMCRILDKAISTGAARTTRSFAYSGSSNVLGRWLVQPDSQTQGLYLDGYGAMFFIRVDFPLVAPPQEESPSEVQEAGDRVWSQTVNELRGQPQDVRQTDETAPLYDARKVENLKTTLTRILRHAANIRTPRPRDFITLVIGTQDETLAYYGRPQLGQPYGDSYRSLYNPGSRTWLNANRAEVSMPDPSGTLVMRVGKSDVNAFAAGELTAEQFSTKVEMLWSWPLQNAQETPESK